jgi:hypothetical protein
VRTAGPRIEAIRFSLLVVLTIGLLSVAFRHDSTPASHSAKAPSSPSSAASPSSPPSVLPTSSTRPGGTGTTGTGTTGTGTTGTGTTGTALPTLPMTGWDGAVRLGALGALLVTSGAMSLSASRAPRRRS